jgi:hypothetical protein
MNEPRNGNDLQIGLLDRLATGDLDGPSRRELFAWLDREPALWRRCALALLEARELELALGDWKAEGRSEMVPRPRWEKPCLDERSKVVTDSVLATPEPPLPRIQVRPWRVHPLALAASLLIAFGLGMTMRGSGIAPQAVLNMPPDSAPTVPSAKPASHDGALVAAAGQAQSREHDRAESIHNDGVHNDDGRSTPESAERLPAYVRSQLERRGYRVDSRHGVVPVSLPDGRRVMLPVDQLQFSYVGRKSY